MERVLKYLERGKVKMKKILTVMGSVVGAGVMAAPAHAAFTLPTLPTADIEAAGTAVAALIAVAVVIGVVFRLLKKA